MSISAVNDPIAGVSKAFEKLYPSIEVELWYDPCMKTRGKGKKCGETFFPIDGGIPIISINANIPYFAVVETIAHELAHVATPGDKEHGKEWSDAFQLIFDTYNADMSEAKAIYETT